MRGNSLDQYKAFARIVNDQTERLLTIRGLFRIKSPEELTRHLGMPFLGMIPALFDLDASSPLINSAVPPNFSECFRTLRTNVLFSTADEGLRSLVVTSTGPGEGKTLVSTNLAVGLAQAGMRVLLIDADMRKPRVHSVFDKPRQPGLSNVLVGTARFSETVHATTVIFGFQST